jgi:hypothetical protein
MPTVKPSVSRKLSIPLLSLFAALLMPLAAHASGNSGHSESASSAGAHQSTQVLDNHDSSWSSAQASSWDSHGDGASGHDTPDYGAQAANLPFGSKQDQDGAGGHHGQTPVDAGGECDDWVPAVIDKGANCVSAVPEPETYGMLLAGLGLLAFVARRKAGEKQ